MILDASEGVAKNKYNKNQLVQNKGRNTES